MSVDLGNVRPVDEARPANHLWLDKLQGNILRGHGRAHSAHLMVRLPGDVDLARRVLRRLAPQVTSARQQYVDTERHRREGGRRAGPLFVGVSISASGYAALGYRTLDASGGAWSASSRFAAGMKCPVKPDLGDPPVSDWESTYQEQIDVLVLLAHARPSRLRRAVQDVTAQLAPATVSGIEWGRVFRNADRQAIEHFGFVDGRSQPLYLEDDFLMGVAWPYTTRERRDGRPIDAWNPFAPLGTALVTDPLGGDEDSLGSFLAFRKLEQDVKQFVMSERALAQHLGLRGSARRRAGAMVLGRFRNGAPLTCASREEWEPPTDNNFTYQEDARGWRCPLHAHVRRANPRGSSGPGLEAELAHRITRRGVTYGVPTRGVAAALRESAPAAAIEALPSRDVGILFMSYQADIERQFAFMQRVWFSNNFPGGGAPFDIVSGRAIETQSMTWRTQHNGDTTTSHPFGSCVRMRGGEYFFTPGLSFLRTL